jgi:hypothetical protein
MDYALPTHSNKMKTFINRKFQLWEYSVSHGSLLLRSPKRGEDKNNIDIVFAGVEYVSAPRHFHSLAIDDANPDELASISLVLDKKVNSKNVTILVTEGKRHAIVAAVMKIEENEMEMFDSPFKLK